ncbi:Emc [Trypoxylus dichotomus]
MKAVSVLCSDNSGVTTGRITKHKKDIENEEIQMYLSKLKDLVPFMPKNRKLSKLEVIQHVIDYISLSQKKSQGAISPRQPLGVRTSPNTILAPCEAPTLQHITTPEKLSPQDGRPVSC